MVNLKKLLISELERKEILIKHGLLKEQTTPVTKKNELSVESKINFEGGYHSKKYANFSKNLDPLLSQIQNFIKQYKGDKFLISVLLSAGESKLPNTDSENSGDHLVVGELAQKRMTTIEEYVKKFFEPLIVSKDLVSLPSFTRKEIEIGGPDFVGQKFCPKDKLPAGDSQGFECYKQSFNPSSDPNVKITNWYNGKESEYSNLLTQYNDAQFLGVKIYVSNLSAMKKCIDNMEIELNYTDISKKHRCNSSVFKLFINGVQLKRIDGKDYASLNNAGDSYDNNRTESPCYDNSSPSCKRYNKFIISPELADQILSRGFPNLNVLGRPAFNITAQCINPLNITHSKWGDGCHEGVGDIVIKNGLDGEVYNYQAITPEVKNQRVRLVAIEACGTKIPT